MGVLQQAFGQPQSPQRSQLFSQSQSYQQAPQGSPFMSPGAMRGQAMQSQQQPMQQPGDSLSAFWGTAAEEFSHQFTFGIYEPDIISEQEEDIFPTASMLGKIAGNVGGFVANMAVLGGVGKLALGSFTFGKAILAASASSKVISAHMTAKAMPSLFRGGVGAIHTGALFGAHDIAEKFVEQVKENDVNLYEAGVAGISGFAQGSIFGMGQSVFTLSHPLKQMVSGGTSFLLAESIGKVTEGENFTKEEMATTFLTGMAMGGLASRGWKERGEVVKKLNRNVLIDVEKSMRTGDFAKLLTEFNSGPLPTEIESLYALAKKKPLIIGKKKGGDPFYVQSKKGQQWPKSQYEKVKAGGDLLKMESELKTEIMSITKDRTSSLEGITRDEAQKVWEFIRVEAMNQVTGGVDIGGIKGLGLLGRTLTPIDEAIFRTGASDLTDNLKHASMMLSVTEAKFSKAVKNLLGQWDDASKVTLGQKFGAFKANTQVKQRDLLFQMLDTQSGKELNEMRNGLNLDQKSTFTQLRKMTRFFMERMNRTLEDSGQKPIKGIKGYVAHIFKVSEAEKNLGAAPAGEIASVFTPPVKRVSKLSQNFLKERTGAEGYETDVEKALMAMVRFDLKTIWLHKPIELLKARTNVMRAGGEMSKEAADSIALFANVFVAGRPTELTDAANRSLYGFMKNNKVGQAVESIMNKFNRDVSTRPADVVSNWFGKSVSRAYIAGRPKLAIRNMMQSLYVHGYTDTGSLAKAMTVRAKDMPIQYHEITGKSATFNVSKISAEEGMKLSQGSVEEAAYSMFAKSHVFNVETAAKATYFQTIKYINGDGLGYGKQGINWGTEEGKTLRATAKKAGKANWREYLSEEERVMVGKEIDWVVSHTQFIYHATGLPGVFQNPASKAAFKLQSYPMNYFSKYLSDMGSRLVKGTPGWDKTGKLKLPVNTRAGLIKHFVGLGLVVGTIEKTMGLDYSESLGIVRDKDAPMGVKSGVFSMRPSPGVQMFSSMVNIWSDDPYIHAKAKKNLFTSYGMFVPGYLAGRDVQKAISDENGGYKELLFKVKRERTPKGRTTHGVSPFKSFSGFKGFEGF